jgi:uncharacterized protein with PIN domain
MDHSATFHIHGSLNDFLQSTENCTRVPYHFNDKPALKDAIEAIGIPHLEVEAILLNSKPVQFFHPLQQHNQVEVFPADHSLALPPSYSLRPSYSGREKFVLDVHLGKLARSLRMLGFDTLYENNYTDKAIAEIVEKEKRIVLTRDIGLLKHKTIDWGYWLRSQQSEEQMAEVIRYFNLQTKFQPFTRCLACNGMIEKVSKERVADKLPPKTRKFFDEFFQCQSCRRIYWKGSHYERMQQFLSRLNAQ